MDEAWEFGDLAVICGPLSKSHDALHLLNLQLNSELQITKWLIRYKVKPMAFLSLESRLAWGKRDVNTMSLAGVLTQGDRNLLMKGNHCCITSLCFDLVGKRLRWHLMPTRGGYVTSVLLATSSFERKLSEQVWLSWSCLFLEEHQLQTPLCAHPCSGGCPSPWKVGLEFPLVFCSDKALHWGKDASAFLSSGQPFL